MRHITIDYGIDLGTTNSAICRIQQGVPVIIKSDTGMETMPSCVSFKKNGDTSVGFSAYSDLGRSRLRALKRNYNADSNSCVEFKRFMGSDTTFSTSLDDHCWSPEELSALVLKTLCSFVTDDEVKAAVITVPAKFTVNQKDATLQAARLAGIEQVELLQEPIAASMAYGLKAEEKNGIWMVFDFGGGTLDVALVRVSDGVMQVFDTEGDNYLGGKNLDEAIVSRILLPKLLSRFVIDLIVPLRRSLLVEALKVEAEKLKNALSYKESETVYLEGGDWGDDDDGEEIDMEITVTRSELEEAIRPVLQKTIDVCRTLMMRNNITYGKLSHLILIGGPTYIPLLRTMLREQVTENVETGIDPMTAVAQGAALYASSIPVKITESEQGSAPHIKLNVGYETTTVDEEAYITVKMPEGFEGMNCSVKLIRRSDGWESPLTPVGEQGALLIADLLRGPNVFRLSAYCNGEEVRCFPAEITILQGTKTGSAILPYHIGIEVYNEKKKRRVFTAVTGLEKNRPLPASGTVYGLKTINDLNAGEEFDLLRIAIYQGDADAEGKTAALYEHVSDVIITGDDIVSYIPQGSVLNVRIDVDRSEMMNVTCTFPETDQEITKALDTSVRQRTQTFEYLRDLIERARRQVRRLIYLTEDNDLRQLNTKIDQVEWTLKQGSQHKQVEQHIKEILRTLEDYELSSEWDCAYYSLEKAFMNLQILAAKFKEDPSVATMVDNFSKQIERINYLQDIEKADFLEKQIDDYSFAINIDENYRNFIRWANNNFRYITWMDQKKAQKYVLEAMELLKSNPLAPYSETKDLAHLINNLIKQNSSQANQTNSGSASDKMDIPKI